MFKSQRKKSDSSSWALRVSQIVRKVLKCMLELRAFILRECFYCNALQGESEYNISINSDLSVSCNCQDRGEGSLGYLNEASFEEIFFGSKANAFRESLDCGKLPILTCARCSELKRAQRTEDRGQGTEDSGNLFSSKTSPSHRRSERERPASCISHPAIARLPYRGMLVENTIACNLACPGCIRKEVIPGRRKMALSMDDLQLISSTLARIGLKKLFYFNRGEPFLSPGILAEMKIIRKNNPDLFISVSTNGTFLDNEDKREAALMMDRVVFSIDGCDQKSLQKYQRGGDFERALNNLRELVRFRDARGLQSPQIEWKYLLFNWNDRPEQIAQAISLAKKDLPSHKKHKKAQAVSTTYNKEITGAAADVISFWPTNNPFYGISWRYRLGLLNHIGNKSWKGREIRLRPESAEPVESA